MVLTFRPLGASPPASASSAPGAAQSPFPPWLCPVGWHHRTQTHVNLLNFRREDSFERAEILVYQSYKALVFVISGEQISSKISIDWKYLWSAFSQQCWFKVYTSGNCLSIIGRLADCFKYTNCSQKTRNTCNPALSIFTLTSSKPSVYFTVYWLYCLLSY